MAYTQYIVVDSQDRSYILCAKKSDAVTGPADGREGKELGRALAQLGFHARGVHADLSCYVTPFGRAGGLSGLVRQCIAAEASLLQAPEQQRASARNPPLAPAGQRRFARGDLRADFTCRRCYLHPTTDPAGLFAAAHAAPQGRTGRAWEPTRHTFPTRRSCVDDQRGERRTGRTRPALSIAPPRTVPARAEGAAAAL
jgi:hypothetical protein